MRVDVVDLPGDRLARWNAARIIADAAGLGVGLKHVVGVVRRAVAEHLGVDRCASRPRGLELLQDEDRCALAHDEALALRVERAAARGGRRCRRRAAHGAESREDERVDAPWYPAMIDVGVSPWRTSSAASPIACEPVAQAETTA